ncbi:SET (Su(var)3-9, Enhancer-of-zeste, Trithorax) domain [Teratosphaeria destructans]|uniref:SET (Su(Var)3-9, Enhancer-of-zeste, Trithorax) domain n=1 Tax=Teratosphaeria destructans TaxID=418781 RepID=A0A9W7SM17_9PEZI|nr:SET (Su(var)3-9, Enhancer-of-zeste, Trithorax) domain [Teratosphaeria destructans]
MQTDAKTIPAALSAVRAPCATLHRDRQDWEGATPSADPLTIDLTLSDDDTSHRTQQSDRGDGQVGPGQRTSHADQPHLNGFKDLALSRATLGQSGRSDPVTSTAKQRHTSHAGASTVSSRLKVTARPMPKTELNQDANKAEAKFGGPKNASASATTSKTDQRDSAANEKSSARESLKTLISKQDRTSSRRDPMDGSVSSRELQKTDSTSHERDLAHTRRPPIPASRSNLRDGMAALDRVKRHREGGPVEEAPAAKKPRVETHGRNDSSKIPAIAAGGIHFRRPAIVPIANVQEATAQQTTAKKTMGTLRTPPRRPPANLAPSATGTSTFSNGRSDVIVLDDELPSTNTLDLVQDPTRKQKQPGRQDLVIDLSNDEAEAEAGAELPGVRIASLLNHSPRKHRPAPAAPASPVKPSEAIAGPGLPKPSRIAQNESQTQVASSVRAKNGLKHESSRPTKVPPTREGRQPPQDWPMGVDASTQESKIGKNRSKPTLVNGFGVHVLSTPIASSPGKTMQNRISAQITDYESINGPSSEKAAVAAAIEKNVPCAPDVHGTTKSAGPAQAVSPTVPRLEVLRATLPLSSTVNGATSNAKKQAVIDQSKKPQEQPNDTSAPATKPRTAISREQQRPPGRIAQQLTELVADGRPPSPLYDLPHSRDIASNSRARHERSQAVVGTSEHSSIASPPKNPFNQFMHTSNEAVAQMVEQTVGAELGNYAADNEYYSRIELKQARLSKRSQPPGDITSRDAPPGGASVDRPYSFKSWATLTLEPRKKGAVSNNATFLNLERAGKPGKLKLALQHAALEPRDEMPGYAHYVSIKKSFLAPNSRNLHYWPYFTDDFDYDTRAESLKDQYDLDIRDRRRKLARLQRAESLHAHAEQALKRLDLTWADVLSYLLDPRPNVGDGNPDALRALADRDLICDEDFKRGDERAQTVLSCLPAPKPERIGRAAVLCERFSKMANISLWQMARKHLLDTLPQDTSKGQEHFLDAFTCRVCLRFDCPYHGKIDEYDDEYDELDDLPAEERKENPVITDIIHPRKVNYRTRTAFNPAPVETSEATAGPTLKKRDLGYWQKVVHDHVEQDVFTPCHHPGLACDQAECSCYDRRLPCEKTCSCSTDCARKFPGCSCKRGGKKVCFEDERCLCSQLGRECDPDLCGSCGVVDIVDPMNRYDEEICKGKCKNAGIQRGVPKRTMIGTSAIHGFGLYIGEDVGPNEFIGEYKGEIIMKEEAERRGAVYEFQGLSYLFALNKTQEIDSTYFGNKIRFINHANAGHNNTYPRVRLVNAVHHIALYSKYKLKAGEELFFDYGPKFGNEALGGSSLAGAKKKSRSGAKARDANVVLGQEYEVEHEVDERGNRRAIKGAKRRRPRRGLAAAGLRKQQSTNEADDVDENAEDHEMQDADEVDDAQLAEPEGAGARLTAYYIDGSDGIDATEVTREPEDEEDDDFVYEGEEEISSDRGVAEPPFSSSPPRPRTRGRSQLR